MEDGTRDELLAFLADAIGSVEVAHPTRVAIDGPPAGGKTSLGDELATALRARGRPVVRSTIEGFLRRRAERYRRGVFSGEGCYHDSFDLDALHRVLLAPLGPGGDRRIQDGVYDKGTDAATSPPVTTAPADAVLLFDGVFLLRPELVDRWELSIYVAVGLDERLARARVRDAGLLDVERWHRERYQPAQDLYDAEVRPTDLADIVVHNDDLRRPAWETRPN